MPDPHAPTASPTVAPAGPTGPLVGPVDPPPGDVPTDPPARHRRREAPQVLTTVVCALLVTASLLPTADARAQLDGPVASATMSATAAPHSTAAVAALDAVPPRPGELLVPGPPVSATEAAIEEAEPEPEPVATYLGGLPAGIGMYLWQPEHIEGGDVAAMVAKAEAHGLAHLYVRTGSSRMGFYAGEFLDALLPAAHAAGLRVYGWDFPYFYDVEDDVNRALAAIGHRTPDGHRIDGFVADVETPAEGTQSTPDAARTYGLLLRERAGPDEVLIACVPNPTAHHQRVFPYDQLLDPFDAIQPMVYWLNREPDTDVTAAVQFFERFGKPVLPIGQAYDGGPEGGRWGPPPPHEIKRFVQSAVAAGAQEVSFWSWQHATPEIWKAISESTVPTPEH